MLRAACVGNRRLTVPSRDVRSKYSPCRNRVRKAPQNGAQCFWRLHRALSALMLDFEHVPAAILDRAAEACSFLSVTRQRKRSR